MFDARRGWLLPGGVALLASGLGVVTNLATDLRSSWWAWGAVIVLTVGLTGGTVLLERRDRKEQKSPGSVMANTSTAGHTSESLGLQMRRVRTSNPDGSITVVTEIFSEELARQSLRDNSIDEDI